MFELVQSFDDYVLHAFVVSRADVPTAILKAVSFFGEWYMLLPLAAVIVFLLARRGFLVQATELAYVVVGASLAVVVIKFLVARPRPPEELRLVYETGYSFPSWHAALAIALWGYLAYFALKHLQSRTARIAVVFGAAFIILATDVGRLYLGVHYASDVLAGTLLGGLILLFAL